MKRTLQRVAGWFGVFMFLAAAIPGRAELTAGNTAVGTNVYPESEINFKRVAGLTNGNAYIGYKCAVVDPVHGFAYFGTRSIPTSEIVKVRLSDFTEIGRLTMPCDEMKTAVIDPAGGYAYFAGSNFLLYRVRLSDFTLDGTLYYNRDVFNCGVIDTAGGYAYFGTHASAGGSVVRVRLSDFSLAGELPVNLYLITAVIDPAGGYAYFGSFRDTISYRGQVYKIRLSDFTLAGMMEFGPGERYPYCSVIDPACQNIYFGTMYGTIAKIRLSDFTEVSSATLATNTNIYSTAIDSEYVYYGEWANNHKIHRYRQSDLSYAGFASMLSDEGYFQTAVTDPSGDYVYFGSAVATTGFRILKVALRGVNNCVRASKITLPESCEPQSVRFYSHQAGGNVRLAIYSEGTTRTLLWQSGSVANSAAGWLDVPIASGTPASLELAGGTYWLASNLDSTAGIASYTPAADGEGFKADLDFGAFPAKFGPGSTTSVAGVWSQYLVYDRVAPENPDSPAAAPLSTGSIRWSWRDRSDNESGFKVYADPGTVAPSTLRTTTTANITSWTMTGLLPNTQYACRVAATNDIGDSGFTNTVTTWTLARAPRVSANVTCNRTTGTLLAAGTALTFTNPAGFGPAITGRLNRVAAFRYALTLDPYYVFTGSEPAWSVGSLVRTPPGTGSYYMHLQSLNVAGVPQPVTLAYGPFYIGEASYTLGITDPGANYPDDWRNFRRVASLAGSGTIYCGTLDPLRGYVYFAGGIDVNKIRLSDFTPQGSLSTSWIGLSQWRYSAIIDPVRGYAYFGSQARIMSLNLNTFSWENADNGIMGGSLITALADPAAGYGYFAAGNGIARVSLADIKQGTSLSISESSLTCGAIDPPRNVAYFGNSANPAKVVEVRLNPLWHTRTLSLPGIAGLRSAVIDPARNFTYFGTSNPSGGVNVVKVALPDLALSSTLVLGAGENNLVSAAMEPSGVYAYFGTGGAPGRIVSVRLSDFTRAGAFAFNYEENNFPLRALVMDPSGDYLYAGAYNSGNIVKFSLRSIRDTVWGTRLTLPESAEIREVKLFSKQAGGNVKLAIYSNATPPLLLWQSPATSNTLGGGWISVPVSAGAPASLTLPAGDYWLAFITDSPNNFAGLTVGAAGDGFKAHQSFRSSLDTLTTRTITSERWSEYVNYVRIKPAAPTGPVVLSRGLDWINWGWTDNSDNEAGFKVWLDDGIGDPATLSGTIPAGMTGWAANWLSPNSPYSFKIAASNSVGDSTQTLPITGWTAIEPVTGLSFDPVTANSIGCEITDALISNLSEGESGLMISNTVAGTDSGWMQNLGDWVSSGLTPNTAYTFNAQTRNGERVLTPPASAVKYTLALPPASGINITCNRQLSTWYGPGTSLVFTNPAGFTAGTHGGGSHQVSGFRTALTTNPGYSFTGAEPTWNSGTLTYYAGTADSYYIHLQSLNAEGVANPLTLDLGPYTIDHTMPAKPAAPTADGPVTTSGLVTFRWVPPVDTESGVGSYDCQIGTAPGASGVYSGNVGNVTTKVVTWPVGQSVYCRVRAIDKVGNAGPWSDSSSGVFIDTMPAVQAVTFTPAVPRTMDDIAAVVSATETDAGDSVEGYRYEWLLGGEVKSTSSTLNHALTAKGQAWTLKAWAVDSHGGLSQPGQTTVTIANTLPSQPLVLIRPQPAAPGQDLIVDVQTYSVDPDGDPVEYDFQWFKSIDNGLTWTHKVELNGSSQVSGQYIFDGELWEVHYIPYEKNTAGQPGKAQKPQGRVEGTYGWDRAYIGANNLPKLSLGEVYAQRQPSGTWLGIGWSFHDPDNQACTVDLDWTNSYQTSYQQLARGIPAKQGSFQITGQVPLDKPLIVLGVIRDAKGAVTHVLSAPAQILLDPSAGSVAEGIIGRTPLTPDMDFDHDGKTDSVDIVRAVGAEPPAAPAPSAPADGTAGVSLTLTLNWDDPVHAKSYDVYVWPAQTARPASPTASGLVHSYHPITNPLNRNTKYWWQVVAVNGSVRIPGAIREFTTIP